MTAKRTPAGFTLTNLILEVMNFYGILREHGQRIAGTFGQSPARWQVLGAVAERAMTASQVSRRMGLSRQSVQRLANELTVDGFIRTNPNPDHARAPLLDLTIEGRTIYNQITLLQIKWSNRLARQMDMDTLMQTHAGLLAIRTQLEQATFPHDFFSDTQDSATK